MELNVGSDRVTVEMSQSKVSVQLTDQTEAAHEGLMMRLNLNVLAVIAIDTHDFAAGTLTDWQCDGWHRPTASRWRNGKRQQPIKFESI